jgi:hypothetical protein
MKSRFSLVLLLTFVCGTFSYSQSTQRDNAAIRYAKNIYVSRIEPGMPKVKLEPWLKQTLGNKRRLKWEVNDCGEQSGTLADRGRDFPMCVQPSVETMDLYIGISLQVGTFKKGIRRDHIQIRGIGIHIEGEGNYEVTKLSSLTTKIRELGVDLR